MGGGRGALAPGPADWVRTEGRTATARQVVLVRTKEAEARLPAALRDGVALVMTVAQSKGLEFDDVFLFDFFRDSPATKGQWRALLEEGLMEHLVAECGQGGLGGQGGQGGGQESEQDAEARGQGYLRPLAADSPDRAAELTVLCEELKHLCAPAARVSAPGRGFVSPLPGAQRPPLSADTAGTRPSPGLRTTWSSPTATRSGGRPSSRCSPAWA